MYGFYEEKEVQKAGRVQVEKEAMPRDLGDNVRRSGLAATGGGGGVRTDVFIFCYIILYYI